MARRLRTYIGQLRTLSDTLDVKIEGFLYRKQSQILQRVRQRLMEYGIVGDTYLGEYADVTIEIKRKKRQRYDHVTLRDTHAFHKAYRLEITWPKVDLFNTDPKAGKLDTMYGDYIFDFSLDPYAPLGSDADFIYSIIQNELIPQLIKKFNDTDII